MATTVRPLTDAEKDELAPFLRQLQEHVEGCAACHNAPVPASAAELGEPRLLDLIRDGNPIYAWPLEERHVWHLPDVPLAGRVLERATRTR